MPIPTVVANNAPRGPFTLAFWLFLVLLYLPSWVEAEESLEVLFGLSTTHILTNSRNEDNQMIGVEHDWGHCVTFVNSFNRRSVGCGVGYRYDLSRLSFGARIGAVSGYQKVDFGKHSEYMPCTDQMCAYGSPYIDFRLTQNISLETIFYITSIVLVAKFSFG